MTEILEILSEQELLEMESSLLEEQFNLELDEPDPYPELILLNKVTREKLVGFGEFISELSKKVGPKTPIKVGESYANLVITPLGVLTLCGYRLRPQDQFGIRLYELLELLTVEFENRDLEFKKRLVWEVNRTKGALRAFGRTSVAKKFSQSGRVAALLVNRATEDIDPHIALINQKDSDRYFLEEGSLTLIGRYPGSSFSTHMIVINNLVPESTIYTSTKALLSHQGDTDGDTVLVLKVKEG